MIAVRRRLARNVALVATVVAVSPLLAGCWQGFGASTTMQNSMNSGNGTQEIVGSLRVENATIVFVVCDRGDRYLSTGVFPE